MPCSRCGQNGHNRRTCTRSSTQSSTQSSTHEIVHEVVHKLLLLQHQLIHLRHLHLVTL